MSETIDHIGEQAEQLLDTLVEAGCARLADDKHHCTIDDSAIPHIEAALRDCVAATWLEASTYIRELKQYRIPEPLRNCDFYGEREHEEGWCDYDNEERSLLNGVASALAAKAREVGDG